METLNEFLIDYGYVGMAIAAFLSGSLVPISSEAVMAALLAMSDMDPWMTMISASIGNIGGSMFNYGLGRLSNTRNMHKWLRIKEKRLEKTKDLINRKGSWIALFTFLPILGEAIAIAMGMLKINIYKVLLYTTIGKVIRYVIVGYTVIVLKGEL